LDKQYEGRYPKRETIVDLEESTEKKRPKETQRESRKKRPSGRTIKAARGGHLKGDQGRGIGGRPQDAD